MSADKLKAGLYKGDLILYICLSSDGEPSSHRCHQTSLPICLPWKSWVLKCSGLHSWDKQSDLRVPEGKVWYLLAAGQRRNTLLKAEDWLQLCVSWGRAMVRSGHWVHRAHQGKDQGQFHLQRRDHPAVCSLHADDDQPRTAGWRVLGWAQPALSACLPREMNRNFQDDKHVQDPVVHMKVSVVRGQIWHIHALSGVVNQKITDEWWAFDWVYSQHLLWPEPVCLIGRPSDNYQILIPIPEV